MRTAARWRRLSCHAVTLHVLAFWPVWWWSLARLHDGSDEPWGILALVAAAAYVLDRLRRPGPGPGEQQPPAPGFRAAAPLFLLIAYILIYPRTTPLPRGILAMLCLGLVASRSLLGVRFHPGFTALLLLSLPVVASLQFYGGYPVRLLTARAASFLITSLGYPTTARGTFLVWRGDLVSVDAPCSGIKMLWTGLFLCFTLCCFREISPRRTWIAYVMSSITIFSGNVLRTTLLFFTESRILPAPAGAHEGIGLLCFTFIALVILRITEHPGHRQQDPAPAPGAPECPGGTLSPIHRLALLATALAPVIHPPPTLAGAPRSPPTWPETLEGASLMPLPLTPPEQSFATGFPGHLARFTDGSRAILLRHIRTPSRRVHPSSDCYRAMGFAIEPGALRVDSSGHRWGTFHARDAGGSYHVRERIVDARGGEFTDVSTWYWEAVLGRSPGPWLAWTLASRE